MPGQLSFQRGFPLSGVERHTNRPSQDQLPMQPFLDHDNLTLYCGDLRDVLPTLLGSSVDFVVTEGSQGQRVLTACSGKDLEHVVIVPTASATFHGHAVFVGMLLQQGQREAIQPSEVLAETLITDA